MNRTDRLAALLTLLQSAHTVSARRITDRFGIGKRTLYRDIRALEEAGIPVAGDSRGGYSLAEGFKLPPLMFTRSEAFAFLAAERLIGQFTDTGVQESYRSGMDKIRAVMRMGEKEEVSAAGSRIGTLEMHNPYYTGDENRLQRLMDSAARGKRIEITYFSRSREQTLVRMVDPVGIFFSVAHWYLVAFCHERNDYRTFKVSRILSLRQIDEAVTASHPPLKSFLQWPEAGDDLQEVVLRISKEEYPVLDESKYYQGLTGEKLAGKEVELRFRTFSLRRFARWYLSYADVARIASPPELTGEVARLLEKIERG